MTPAGEAALDAAAWRSLVKSAEQEGDLLGAYDRAMRGLGEHPGDDELSYRAVLNLSRSGANDRAAVLFAEFGLRAEASERLGALDARILREQAMAMGGDAQTALLAEAARRYARVYDATGSTFPGINAATLTLLAGDPEQARVLARRVLDDCRRSGIEDFGRAADAAAAALILDERAEAARLIAQCARSQGQGGSSIALAATRRQLARICDAQGGDRAILAPLTARTVLHYTGHMISPPGKPGRFPAEAEGEVAAAIAAWLDANPVGHGFGSLACGADILVAEALVGRGAELHLVFPFALDEFRDASVVGGGEGWLARFESCLARAASMTFATEDRYLGDDVLFGHCAHLAMGLALLRGRYLDAPVTQLAIWDGVAGGAAAGTAADVAAWGARGLGTTVIPTRSTLPAKTAAPAGAPPAANEAGRPARAVKAMLFGDAKGFSKLTDAQIPVFVEHFLAAIGRVLARHRDRVEFANTWGDGLYVVLRDPRSAMDCALDLHAEVAALDCPALGLPRDMALRIGGHAGPVFAMDDPILDRRNFMGSHVSRTARLEPITPEGEVYVTEAFAALIALERDARLNCDYVGILPAAKSYGSFRMYVLRRSPPA